MSLSCCWQILQFLDIERLTQHVGFIMPTWRRGYCGRKAWYLTHAYSFAGQQSSPRRSTKPSQDRFIAIQGTASQRQSSTVDCRYYAKSHEKTKLRCPVYGEKCKKCGRNNRFTAKCKACSEHRKKKLVHKEAEWEKTSLCIKVVTENVNEVDTKRVNDSQLFASMLMDNNIIKFQTDCGAACNMQHHSN